ncbi:2-Hacid_dh_C domain-containing protein [Psidium guajava]|nr:2-Hacid_dh_C domain-containing protein [Psidium guajava]
MSAADRYLREGSWLKNGNYPLGFKLGGKRVGIVGLGNIGSQVAKRLQPFGCDIAYNSRSKKPSRPFPYYASVHDLAAVSDVLILCCALTEETHHVINRAVMTVLGDRGVIINVGRGSLIDEKELVQCLVQGELGGAGLDVFEDEPNVPKELFGLHNVVLSPHSAVGTPESFRAMRELTISNLKAFFSNEPLSCLVQDE